MRKPLKRNTYRLFFTSYCEVQVRSSSGSTFRKVTSDTNLRGLHSNHQNCALGRVMSQPAAGLIGQGRNGGRGAVRLLK